jgi:hypothetical protein
MARNYEGMDLDELIEEFKIAAIKDIDGPGQEAAVDEINAVKREIAKRPRHMDRYRGLLVDPDPLIRYSAAVSVKDVDPEVTLSVFKELRDGHYGIGDLAWIELRELRLRGYV